MSFQIVCQDITKMQVDAIVNAANAALQMGGGVCGAIFQAAGAERMQEACNKVAPVPTGSAAITSGFDLPARYVIHTVGPVYRSNQPERCRELLYSAYTEALKLAEQHGCESIAFPLISSGVYGYPKGQALEVAKEAIDDFLNEHNMDIYLVVFDESTYVLSRALLG